MGARVERSGALFPVPDGLSQLGDRSTLRAQEPSQQRLACVLSGSNFAVKLRHASKPGPSQNLKFPGLRMPRVSKTFRILSSRQRTLEFQQFISPLNLLRKESLVFCQLSCHLSHACCAFLQQVLPLNFTNSSTLRTYLQARDGFQTTFSTPQASVNHFNDAPLP